MQEIYSAHGVRFRYPPDWEVTEEKRGSDVSITVASPETSFWSVTLLPECPDPQRAVESAVQAFQEEYEDVDVYPVEGGLCHRPNIARDIEFVCYELINSAFLRAFRTDRFTALVLYQGTDHELKETRDLMEEISSSLQCDFDDGVFPP